jgi:tRNA U34 5-carboxymethylaminomethyl modifying enzyme MnmG/GidA
MNKPTAEETAQAIAKLNENREELLEAEQEWKGLRYLNRQMTLELVTQHGVSVAKASRLSGHTRQTIKIWLDVWNAEHKSAQK